MYLELEQKKYMPPRDWENHTSNGILELTRDLIDSGVWCEDAIRSMINKLYKKSGLPSMDFPRIMVRAREKAGLKGWASCYKKLNRIINS